ncbi:MAG: hypothetical protein WBA29_00475 [Xanthobacteraceae bacterium]
MTIKTTFAVSPCGGACRGRLQPTRLYPEKIRSRRAEYLMKDHAGKKIAILCQSDNFGTPA